MLEPKEILEEWVENGVVGGVIGKADGHREERGGEQATGSYAEGDALFDEQPIAELRRV